MGIESEKILNPDRLARKTFVILRPESKIQLIRNEKQLLFGHVESFETQSPRVLIRRTSAAAPPSEVQNPQVFSPSPSLDLPSSSSFSSLAGGRRDTPKLTVPPGGRDVTSASL